MIRFMDQNTKDKEESESNDSTAVEKSEKQSGSDQYFIYWEQ